MSHQLQRLKLDPSYNSLRLIRYPGRFLGSILSCKMPARSILVATSLGSRSCQGSHLRALAIAAMRSTVADFSRRST